MKQRDMMNDKSQYYTLLFLLHKTGIYSMQMIFTVVIIHVCFIDLQKSVTRNRKLCGF